MDILLMLEYKLENGHSFDAGVQNKNLTMLKKENK
jgi:hypothetical protein